MTNFKVSSYVCATFIFALAFNLLVGHNIVLIYRCLKQGCRFFVPQLEDFFFDYGVSRFYSKISTVSLGLSTIFFLHFLKVSKSQIIFSNLNSNWYNVLDLKCSNEKKSLKLHNPKIILFTRSKYNALIAKYTSIFPAHKKHS